MSSKAFSAFKGFFCNGRRFRLQLQPQCQRKAESAGVPLLLLKRVPERGSSFAFQPTQRNFFFPKEYGTQTAAAAAVELKSGDLLSEFTLKRGDTLCDG